jgi:hypothetical protein
MMFSSYEKMICMCLGEFSCGSRCITRVEPLIQPKSDLIPSQQNSQFNI